MVSISNGHFNPKYLLDRRLGRLQSQCGNDGEELHSHQELNPQLFTSQPTA
jgi:hypothetical protein